MHRVVLNQILRQSTTPLSEGPFSVLVDYTKVLDFDVKRRYFRQELERMDDGVRREDLAVHVRRDNIFEDSFRELHRRTPDEWKHRFYIVFEGQFLQSVSYIALLKTPRNENCIMYMPYTAYVWELRNIVHYLSSQHYVCFICLCCKI